MSFFPTQAHTAVNPFWFWQPVRQPPSPLLLAVAATEFEAAVRHNRFVDASAFATFNPDDIPVDTIVAVLNVIVTIVRRVIEEQAKKK